jgi:hypothetical protein
LSSQLKNVTTWLQKIASLEEELALEIAQEQERKHQLQLIEELSNAAQSSKYKAEFSRHFALKQQASEGAVCCVFYFQSSRSLPSYAAS